MAMTEKKPRNTVQKKLLFDHIKKYKSHFTADELVEMLKSAGTPVGKATVYRNLKSFEKSGIIRCYHLPGDCACYQYIDSANGCNEHYHLKCTACGQLIHVDKSYVNTFKQGLIKAFGFDMDMSRTVIYGYCAKCREGVC